MTAPRQVTRDQWDRMSWHARRAYEARGGVAPDGCSREDRRRARLEAAGVPLDAIEVVLGYRKPARNNYDPSLAELQREDALERVRAAVELEAARLFPDYRPP